MKLNIEIQKKITSLLLQKNSLQLLPEVGKKSPEPATEKKSGEVPTAKKYFCAMNYHNDHNGEFEIRFDGRHYNGVYNFIERENKLQFVVDGYFYEAKRIEESFLLQSLGRANRISAQLPGKIIRVLAKAGDRVVKGQTILVQEAMKMEHSLTAGADRLIKEITVKEGDQVKEEQVLVVFDEEA